MKTDAAVDVGSTISPCPQLPSTPTRAALGLSISGGAHSASAQRPEGEDREPPVPLEREVMGGSCGVSAFAPEPGPCPDHGYAFNSFFSSLRKRQSVP